MQKRKGISLIVLVITIIVMIILAGAIILSLNNSGIIGKANEVVEAADEATVKEIAQLAWAEAYAEGVRTVEGDKGLLTRVKESLKNNGIDPEECLLNVTTSGVTAKLKKNAWIKEEFTVVKGEQVLEIGDIVNYDAGVEGYKGEWKVLGADEDGNLLIMSAADVKTGHRLGYDLSIQTTKEAKIKECQKDWVYGEAELDSICETYGNGKGTVGAGRSITVEDVDKVTGYEKITYAKGNLFQYGNTVTYLYNGTTSPSYTSKVENGIMWGHDSGFYWPDGSKFQHIEDLTAGTSGEVFATLTSNYYHYYAPDLTTISSTENAKAFEMLFGEYDDTNSEYTAYYWLASTYIYTYTGYVDFGMRIVDDGVNRVCLLSSFGHPDTIQCGVRAVVTLSSDIVFTGSSEDGWSY